MKSVERDLVGQKRCLGGHYVYVRVDARLIALHLQIKKLLRRLDRILLRQNLLRIHPRSRQRVLHLLECSQHCLPVGGNVSVVDGLVLMKLRAVQPALEKDLRSGGRERPSAACHVEKMLERRALQSAARADGHLWKERSVPDAD